MLARLRELEAAHDRAMAMTWLAEDALGAARGGERMAFEAYSEAARALGVFIPIKRTNGRLGSEYVARRDRVLAEMRGIDRLLVLPSGAVRGAAVPRPVLPPLPPVRGVPKSRRRAV